MSKRIGILMLGCAVGVSLWLGFGPAVRAFSPLGQFKTWQVPGLGYDADGGDVGGPMTLAEAYRWNVPRVYYAFDQSFIAYFGKEGMAAVEGAIAILNNLPKSSQITDDGVRLYIGGQPVPYDTKRVNYQAQAFGLLDVKSWALALLTTQLSLTSGERYAWTLRARDTETVGNTTFTNYLVINLNYDPITLRPSPYVNNVLYSYRIVDPIRPQNYADAIEFQVDPLAFSFSSVANAIDGAFSSGVGAGITLGPGEFFTGLTHDDVGGVRFLYNPNNFAVEGVVPGTRLGTGSIGVSPWIPFNTLSNFFGTNAVNLPPGLTNVTGTNLTNFAANALRPGLDKITLVRGNFDSLIGQFFITVTNAWTDRYVSNGVVRTQPLERVLNQPDILFTVEDLSIGAGLSPALIGRTGPPGWQNNDALNGVGGGGGAPGQQPTGGGPGVITSPVVITFTEVLPVRFNQSPFLDGGSSFFDAGFWASFDGTTNAPVIYPKFLDLTLQDLSNPALGQSN